MRKGALASLRNLRRWFAHAVMLALVLPALVGVLPQPAVSAAAALDRDLLLSVCGQDGPQQEQGQHQAIHDHCVLCSNACTSISPTLAGGTSAFLPVPRHGDVPGPSALQTIPLPLQALLDASPPRGPPALS